MLRVWCNPWSFEAGLGLLVNKALVKIAPSFIWDPPPPKKTTITTYHCTNNKHSCEKLWHTVVTVEAHYNKVAWIIRIASDMKIHGLASQRRVVHVCFAVPLSQLRRISSQKELDSRFHMTEVILIQGFHFGGHPMKNTRELQGNTHIHIHACTYSCSQKHFVHWPNRVFLTWVVLLRPLCSPWCEGWQRRLSGSDWNAMDLLKAHVPVTALNIF